jgi:hypothetical protein
VNVQIRYQNGCLTISLGQESASGGNPANDPVGSGYASNAVTGGNPANDPVGSGGSECGCCGGLVVGPIIIPSHQGVASGGNPANDPVGSGSPARAAVGGNPANDPVGSGGSNCGCCGPTVIGPIVFTGGCPGSTAPTSQATPLTPVNIGKIIPDLITPGKMIPGIQPFELKPLNLAVFSMQTQAELQWCWAAVAVSVNDFLDPVPPGANPAWTQPTLAAKILPHTCTANPSPNDPCDVSWSLDSALMALGNLFQPGGALFNQFVKFADLQAYWAQLQFPICARIVWQDGSGNAHFIALTEAVQFSNGQQLVTVHDPAPTAFGPAQWDYDALRFSYQSPPYSPLTGQPQGVWNDTYFVQP